MNSVNIIGRLTRDPELRYIPNSGNAVCNFTLAVDKQLSKQKKEEFEQQNKPTADFINIVVWGKQAENSANYLQKGLLTAVEGRIQTSTYEAKEGHTVFKVEVVANSVKFLEWAEDGAGNKKNDTEVNTEGFDPVENENIPF